MGIFQQLMEKPWELTDEKVVARHDRRMFFLPTATLGLRILIAIITVLFSLLIVSYAERMAVDDWHPLPEPWLLWLNTAILIMGSVGLEWASINARREEIDGVRVGLIVAGVCAITFLVGQLFVWRQLADMGYGAAANPAASFFYLITALHGLHLVVGLVAWGRTIDRVWQGIDLARMRLSVELCAVYWHFLLLVWLVLFGLLLFT